MAHHASAQKRIRQTRTRTARNRSLRSSLRTRLRGFRRLLIASEHEPATQHWPQVQRTLDRAVSQGILHRNTAVRYKARLSRALNRLEQA